MKKYFKTIMLIGMILCCVIGCGGLDEQEKQCVLDIQLGLQNRWEFSEAEYKTYEEYQDNVAKGIGEELSMIEKYKNVVFENEDFNEIVKEYIEALENQKEGINSLFTDVEIYNELYVENGMNIRRTCLKQLKESYGLTVETRYEETLDSVLEGVFEPTIAPDKQIEIETEYGKLGVTLNGYDILVNPADEKELVLYCELENISYYDEWNGENIIFDYFMSVYDGEGYNIETKNESYDYINEYKECASVASLRQGEKGKFAVMYDYAKDIDIIYVSIWGTEKSYGCYLPSNSWKSNLNKDNTNNNNVVDNSIDYSIVREQMSNFSCRGMYNIHDGWVYSLNFPKDGGDGLLSKMRTDGTEYTVLTEKGTPNYIYVDGEYIYFIMGDGNTTKIYRCRLGGNDLTQLNEDDAWYLQVCEDYIYYNKIDVSTGITSGFYRAEKDGSNETLIIDKEIYYSYVVGENIYYQDDNDNETIHKYNMTTMLDEKITSAKSYGFVLDGEWGYYIKNDNSAADGDVIGDLVKIDMKTKQETVLYEGVSTSGIAVADSAIYFINTNDENRIYNIDKESNNVKLITQDTNCSNLAIFGDRLMYMDYDDKEEYIDAIYICEEDGSNKVKISKNE